MKQSDLFAPAPQEHPYAATSEKLWALAKRGVYLGSSSWKYESWQGTIYCDDYPTKRSFDENCLEEYARLFPTVSGDFSFYNWPGTEMIDRIARQTPDGFRIALKATEFITLKRYPSIPRWGAKAGQPNPDFLNAKLFCKEFLDRLRPIQTKLAPVILEFTAFPKGSFGDWTEFADLLRDFVTEVRKTHGDFPLGVVRSRELVTEEFWSTLREQDVTPILNSWSRVPPLDEQWKIAEPLEPPVAMARAVMRPGRTRDEAVELFEPYDKKKETVEPARRAIKQMMKWALENNRKAYLLINNHLEGCAHITISEIVNDLL